MLCTGERATVATPGYEKMEYVVYKKNELNVTMADRVYMAGRLRHLAQPDIYHLQNSDNFAAGRQLLDRWHYSHASFLGHPPGIHPASIRFSDHYSIMS